MVVYYAYLTNWQYFVIIQSMNRNTEPHLPKPTRVIEFAGDGDVGVEYRDRGCLVNFIGSAAVADVSRDGDGIAVIRLEGARPENGRRKLIAVGNGVIYNADTDSAKVAPDGAFIPAALIGQPYVEGIFGDDSPVEAVLVRAGENDKDKYEQRKPTREILKRLPKGFKTSRGSE